MSDAMPSFDLIRGLIEAQKPPLTARVTEIRDDTALRSALVIFDGINGWYIDDGERIEFRAVEDRVLFVEAGSVDRYGPGMVASSGNWVKSVIDGRRIAYLDRAEGTVLGRDEVDGRPCWVVEASGLKRDDDIVFTLRVDEQTGVILRMARGDLGEVMRVEELRVGSVHLPDR